MDNSIIMDAFKELKNIDKESTRTKVQDTLKRLEERKVLKEAYSVNINKEEEVNGAKKLINNDETETKGAEIIVDVNAEDVENLKTSYIGDLILQCPICKTKRFVEPDLLDKTTLESSDGETLYNSEDACSHCGQEDGFVLIGQVSAPQSEDAKTTLETSTEETPVKPNFNSTIEDNEDEETDVPVLGEGLTDKGTKHTFDNTFSDTFINNLEQLREEIVLGSYYVEDYENSFGIDPKVVNSFFEGLLEFAVEVLKDPDENDIKEYDIVKTKNPDFWDIIDLANQLNFMLRWTTIAGTNEDDELYLALEGKTEKSEDSDEILELDEKRLNKLVTKYLKETYEDVNEYRTLRGTVKNSNIFLEGIIEYNSGKKEKTKFKFNSKVNGNNVTLLGINENFSKTPAFRAKAKLLNNKLFFESLKYKYKVNDKLVEGFTTIKEARGLGKGQRFDKFFKKSNDLYSKLTSKDNEEIKKVISEFKNLKTEVNKIEPKSDYEIKDKKNLLQQIQQGILSAQEILK